MERIEFFCKEIVPKICKLEKVELPLPRVDEFIAEERVMFIKGKKQLGFTISSRDDMLEKLPNIINELFIKKNDVYIMIDSEFDPAYNLIHHLYSIPLTMARTDRFENFTIKSGDLTVHILNDEFVKHWVKFSDGVMGGLLPYLNIMGDEGHSLFKDMYELGTKFISYIIPFANCNLLIDSDSEFVRLWDSFINFDTGYHSKQGYYRVNKIMCKYFNSEPFENVELECASAKFKDVKEKLNVLLTFCEEILNEDMKNSLEYFIKTLP